MHLSERLLHSTVRVEARGATRGTGTGFIYNFPLSHGKFVLAIVTNKHVVAGASEIILRFTRKNADGLPDYGTSERVVLNDLARRVVVHDGGVDLAVIIVGNIQSL